MRIRKTRFEELVEKNKQELMEDEELLAKLERRLEQKQIDLVARKRKQLKMT
ncbi:FbpB family small basic protein [Virgibacillus halophilus]|uniref:FbpB family small basic protein n=1 Tax=Tigheibacillus halophilus TaxID=361280 RepID=A0ABU5CA59_9BACI|nr:FbpB family small basic protein [Virgibacillus halophilus]